MQTKFATAREAAEDIFFGQIVIIWARWFLILAAIIMSLWSSTTTGEMTASVILVIVLMAINFYVHGRYLMEKPANQMLTLATCLLDLCMVTLIVSLWRGQGGLQNNFFIFYYPLLFAFALVFHPLVTGAYTFITLGCYSAAVILMDPLFFSQANNVKQLSMRLITLAAMSILGAYYYRYQRNQRRSKQILSTIPQEARRAEPIRATATTLRASESGKL